MTDESFPRSRKMAVASDGQVIDAKLCAECVETGEKPVGKTAYVVRIGRTAAPLCVAHAIQLALDTRRAVRKDLPAALTH